MKPEGLQIRLSEGVEGAGRAPANPLAAAAALAENETQNLLRRLRPITEEPDDEKEFAFRDRSLPPPRAGRTIEASFPPRAGAELPTTESGPLDVVRFAPEGNVPIAPHLSITFSQPMVPVTGNDDLAARDVPVKLSPQPPGRWRWVGTRTLLFEPTGRFPMATRYNVEVPAGIRSATGATLGAGKSWSFSTPPAQVVQAYPSSQVVARDPLMFAAFNQRIDPAAVLRTITLRAGNDTNFDPRLATAEEVAADATISRLAKDAQEGRWLAFRVASRGRDGHPLPGNSEIKVSIGPGTPSAEGPLTNDTGYVFTFRTFGPLRVTRSECGYSNRGDCTPFDSWRIEFSNPLDAAAFQQSQVKITPEAPGLKAAVYGNTLTIQGVKRGRTTYTVTLDPGLRDVFGQTLGDTSPLRFNVKSAPPAIAGQGDGFIVVDPYAQPRFSVYTINQPSVKVRVHRVTPADWAAFLEYFRRYTERRSPAIPGRLAFERTVPVQAQPDEMVETRIDLSEALTGGFGHVVIEIIPAVSVERWRRDRIISWVQVTGIGLDAFVDGQEVTAWATSLKDGRPIDGAQVAIVRGGRSYDLSMNSATTTGADGLARIALDLSIEEGPAVLVARKGNDVAMLPESTYWWSGSNWKRSEPVDTLRWYVFDDRRMYKPGEEVHVKGWLRIVGGGKTGDVGPLGDAVRRLTYVLRDSRRNEIAKGQLQVNALGGFDTVLKLPDNMNLGFAMLELQAQDVAGLAGTVHTHNFQVQEFRRPEFEVTAQASDGPHFVSGFATVTANAKYYAGGGLPNAEVRWTVKATPTNYTPPNRHDFIFGKWIPWWRQYELSSASTTQTYSGTTDGTGKHVLRIDFDSANPSRPYTVRAESSVMDVNRQAWSASANLLVHPADLYIGIRSPRVFVQKGEPLIVQSIVTDLDGKLIAGRAARLRAVLLDWVFEGGEWKQKEANPQECNITSTDSPVECRFETKEGGVYRITATVIDDRGRANESEMTLWVAGGKLVPKRDIEQETVELIPSRKEFQPGDTAEILVQAPFYPAEGVLTLRRSGLLRTERFTMDGPSTTLRIPIEEAHIPNLIAQVDLAGASSRGDESGASANKLPKRPAFASGTLTLTVPPLARKLAVNATPRAKALEPGGTTTVDVEVKDAAGEPVRGSELALVVVDEAILSLTNYRLADPLSIFYAPRSADTRDYYLRSHVKLANPDDLRTSMSGTGSGVGPASEADRLAMMAPGAVPAPAAPPMMQRGKAMDASGGDAPINVRQDFNALATFAASVPTDANGRASVEVKLPDNLTRYRVMAVAVAGGKQFGSTESNITARLPLMVRPSAPRFMNFGDRVELPVVLQNQTDEAMQVDVAVRAANAQLIDGAGRRVTVPANDRVEVRFPVTTVKPGTARFQIVAASGKWADAAEIELPVWTPATTEAFATYGEIDQGAIVQPVQAPSDVVPQFGGLEVTPSSTELQSLTDAVIYLTNYPFDCAEQIASRVLGIAALRDVLSAFQSKNLPKPEEMIAAVNRDMKRLEGLQNNDGGFGFWRRGDESWPYISLHVAHALARAKEKNFDVPPQMLARSQDYLKNIESRIPGYYSIEARRALIAYALYVRARLGDRDAARARRLIQEAGLENLSLETVGWLLSVLSPDAASRAEVAAIRRHLNNRVEETAGAAHFTSRYSDGAHLLLHSGRRADGVILEALIDDQPSNDLIPKIVRGLLAHRKHGRWLNTQENAFILLALDRYFAVFEKTTPNFIARAWLGTRYAGEGEFRGRETKRYRINIPMRYVAQANGPQNLTLSKDGPGRLYYRIGLQYAPANLQLKPADYGFSVERVYEAVDNPDDVRRDADGTWRIRAGARVRVRLTMVAPARRYHVALVDPLPAGLEPMNPALAVTGSIPRDPKEANDNRWWWWMRTWYEHQNLRDERVEAFASLLWEGVHTYSYVARATTPGSFIVPPPKAEEMYMPETFGRGATDRVIIE